MNANLTKYYSRTYDLKVLMIIILIYPMDKFVLRKSMNSNQVTFVAVDLLSKSCQINDKGYFNLLFENLFKKCSRYIGELLQELQKLQKLMDSSR